jgi:hypothetical protein
MQGKIRRDFAVGGGRRLRVAGEKKEMSPVAGQDA